MFKFFKKVLLYESKRVVHRIHTFNFFHDQVAQVVDETVVVVGDFYLAPGFSHACLRHLLGSHHQNSSVARDSLVI